MLLAVAASAFSPAVSNRPLIASGLRNTVTPVASLANMDLLAGIIPGIEGYGGTATFWDRAGSTTTDLAQVGFLAVGFPLVLCIAVYKDNIADIFAPPPEVHGRQKLSCPADGQLVICSSALCVIAGGATAGLAEGTVTIAARKIFVRECENSGALR